MPAAFLGHGTPMNALDDNRYTSAWRAFGASVPRPRSILIVSAHWYLNATAVTNVPKDDLTLMASNASHVSDDTELAPPGMEGGFQLQVASFKEQDEADRLVEDLRKRGHRALRQAAHVPERGVWHRVRIGPFRTKFEALKYKEKFEKSERISPFLVDPDKVKQAEDMRAARVAAQDKKKGTRLPVLSD